MQYNIFNNDFYEDMPGVPWAYRIDVFIGDPPQAIAKLAKSVKEIDIPDAELETMDAFHAGLVFKIPTRYKNSNSFGAIFNDDKNLSVYKELLKLFRRSYDNREQTIQSGIQNRVINNRYDNNFQSIGTGTYSGKEIARKYANQKEELMLNVYIIDPRKLNYKDTKLDLGLNNVNEEVINGLKANDPEIVAVYTFRDCFVENIETVEFDYSSEECVEWPIKIHFNEMSVDYPHQDKILIPEEDFKMEELTIPQFDKSDASYYTPKATKAKTEADVAEDNAKSLAENLAYLKKIDEKLGAKQGTERKIAVLSHKEDEDESGMDAHGNYGTMAHRTETMRQRVQENQEQIDEEYQVDVMHAAGISSYGNGTKEEVAQQAFQVLDKAVSDPNEPGSYNYTAGTDVAAAAQRVAQGSENYKEETAKNAEEVQFAFMGSTMQQMNHSDDIAGTVENPSNNQTLSYYRDNRNTVEKNAQDQAVVAGMVAEAHNERQAIERERAENSKFYRESKQLLDRGEITQQEWMNRIDQFLAKNKELTDRSAASVEKVNKLRKENPEQAKLLDKYYKESNK